MHDKNNDKWAQLADIAQLMARKEKLDQAAEVKRKYELQRQYLDNQLKSKHEDASKN